MFFLNIIEIVFYIIILFSRFNITTKILLIVIINVISALNIKFKDYLKNTIKEKLPNKKLIKKHIEMSQNIYGMPSGHAQYISFFLVLFYLFFIQTKNSKLVDNTYIYSLIIATVIIYICEIISCIIYNYHTPMQLIVGTIIGGFVSYVSFFLFCKPLL